MSMLQHAEASVSAAYSKATLCQGILLATGTKATFCMEKPMQVVAQSWICLRTDSIELDT